MFEFMFFCSCLKKAVNEQYLQLTGEKEAHITETETTICESKSEIQRLSDAVTRWVYLSVIPLNFIFGAKKELLPIFPGSYSL